jgi:LPXTG-motif cell wall-anchored protein
MFSRKILLLMGAVAVAGWLDATASAQGIVNEPVRFTFSGPVTVPGTTLPAGQYEFILTNSSSDRQLVQISSADGKRIGIFPAIAAARNDNPEKPEVRFHETPANMPQAIATYWYPGKMRGHEFLYSKEQAQMLVKLNKGGVAVADGDTAYTRMTAAEASAPPEPPAVEAPSAAVTPAPAPRTPVEMQARATPEPRAALPRTASSLPIFALIGLGSLFAGLALLSRKRA